MVHDRPIGEYGHEPPWEHRLNGPVSRHYNGAARRWIQARAEVERLGGNVDAYSRAPTPGIRGNLGACPRVRDLVITVDGEWLIKQAGAIIGVIGDQEFLPVVEGSIA